MYGRVLTDTNARRQRAIYDFVKADFDKLLIVTGANEYNTRHHGSMFTTTLGEN